MVSFSPDKIFLWYLDQNEMFAVKILITFTYPYITLLQRYLLKLKSMVQYLFRNFIYLRNKHFIGMALLTLIFVYKSDIENVSCIAIRNTGFEHNKWKVRFSLKRRSTAPGTKPWTHKSNGFGFVFRRCCEVLISIITAHSIKTCNTAPVKSKLKHFITISITRDNFFSFHMFD